ncbi:MAG: nucleotidyltransferase domain-containing protein [Myxococcota bacterium]
MDLDALLADLRHRHGAHLVVLYGSRARGDATPESDVDFAAFADVPSPRRDARRWCGLFLDGFVYPTAVATADADPELAKLVGGRVLADDRGLAGPLLAKLAAADAVPPPPLASDEAQMRRVWAVKMLVRIRRGDVEAHLRRHWLLYQLLEDHFALRGERYRGPKQALAALEAREPVTFARFADALAPGATLDAIEALVTWVVGTHSLD